MLETGWNIVKDAVDKYFSNGYIWVLFLLSIAILFILRSKKRNIVYLLWYCVLFGLVVLNPIVSVILKKLGMSGVHWRVFWFMPIGILICCMFVEMLSYVKTKLVKGICVIITCIILVCSGGWMYSRENFSAAANAYKIPQYILDICEYIPSNSTIMGDDNVMIWIRTYDASIQMPYGRQMIYFGGNEKQTELHSLWKAEILDVATLAEKAIEYNCDYIVCYKLQAVSESWENYNMSYVAETDNFCIYKVNS